MLSLGFWLFFQSLVCAGLKALQSDWLLVFSTSFFFENVRPCSYRSCCSCIISYCALSDFSLYIAMFFWMVNHMRTADGSPSFQFFNAIDSFFGGSCHWRYSSFDTSPGCVLNGYYFVCLLFAGICYAKVHPCTFRHSYRELDFVRLLNPVHISYASCWILVFRYDCLRHVWDVYVKSFFSQVVLPQCDVAVGSLLRLSYCIYCHPWTDN